MNRLVVSLVPCLLGLAMVIAAAPVHGEEAWASYASDKYGFSMLVPAGAQLAEKEFGGGWGELWCEHDGVKLYALAKLGEQATAEEIEKVGVKLTGLPASAWKTIDKGEKSHGWNWYRTVEASQGGTLVFGGYGTGPKGSYLLVLQTTETDYAAYKADYKAWYESITLK